MFIVSYNSEFLPTLHQISYLVIIQGWQDSQRKNNLLLIRLFHYVSYMTKYVISLRLDLLGMSRLLIILSMLLTFFFIKKSEYIIQYVAVKAYKIKQDIEGSKISREKFEPEPGFKPRTSGIPVLVQIFSLEIL